MYIMSISSTYPESYWLNYEGLLTNNYFNQGKLVENYEVNILYLEECIDLNYSVSEAILDYIEDGPRYFTKIVLKDKTLMHFIVRATEAPYLIIVNKEFKDLLARFAINGISFLEEL